MTTSIGAIKPVVHVADFFVRADHAMVSGHATTGASYSVPAASQQAFQNLMRRAGDGSHDGCNSAVGCRGENGLANFVRGQQQDITGLHDSILDYLDKSPHRSMSENAMAQTALMYQVASVSMKSDAVTAVTKTANKSLESLLKNQ